MDSICYRNNYVKSESHINISFISLKGHNFLFYQTEIHKYCIQEFHSNKNHRTKIIFQEKPLNSLLSDYELSYIPRKLMFSIQHSYSRWHDCNFPTFLNKIINICYHVIHNIVMSIICGFLQIMKCYSS